MRIPWGQAGDPAGVEGYRVLHEIGTGGFSTVLVAEEIAAHRRVALKIGKDGAVTTRRRFATEAGVGQRWASTQGVVGVLSLTKTGDGRPVLVMPFFDRGTAAGLLPAAHRLSHPGVAELVRQVAQGLDAMHRQRYVHRDVSPRNILRSSEMGYAIGDLGCTRPSNSITQPPWTEALTPGYAAPEAGDDARAQTIASDVYGLAATTWALFTGEPPHGPLPGPGDSGAARRYAERSSRRPSSKFLTTAGVPDEVAEILTAALDPEPSRRPARVLDLADALNSLELGPTPAGSSAGTAERAAHPPGGGWTGETVARSALGVGPVRPPRAVSTDVAPHSTQLVGTDLRAERGARKKLPRNDSRHTWILGAVTVAVCFVLGYALVPAFSGDARSPSAVPPSRTGSSTTPVPLRVTDLQVTANQPGRVSLAWTPPAVQIDSTLVQRTDLEADGTLSDLGWYNAYPEITEGSSTTVVDVPAAGEQAGFCFRLLFTEKGSTSHSNPVCVRVG